MRWTAAGCILSPREGAAQQIEHFEIYDNDRCIGLARHADQDFRCVVSRRDGTVTRVDRWTDGRWQTDRDGEPPFSLQVLVRHRLKGFC
jgi:hypothetical protein